MNLEISSRFGAFCLRRFLNFGLVNVLIKFSWKSLEKGSSTGFGPFFLKFLTNFSGQGFEIEFSSDFWQFFLGGQGQKLWLGLARLCSLCWPEKPRC